MLDNPTRCQLADLVADAMKKAGIRPHTAQWVRLARLLRPFVPIVAQGVVDEVIRPVGATPGVGMYLLFLPVNLIAFVLLLPSELVRWRRARGQRRNALARLPLTRDAGAYRGGPSAGGDPELAERVAAADQVVCLDFHVEDKSLPVLFGSALGVLSSDGVSAEWFTAYRDAPPGNALDAKALARLLEGVSRTPPIVAHWVWQIDDTYNLEERDTRPW